MKKTDKEIIAKLKERCAAQENIIQELRELNEFFRQRFIESRDRLESIAAPKNYYEIKYKSRCIDPSDTSKYPFESCLSGHSPEEAVRTQKDSIDYSSSFELISIKKCET